MAKPSRKKSVKKKQITTPKLEYGKSYIDLLPDDVLEKIFFKKHQLEFSGTLAEIKKVQEVHEIIDNNKIVLQLLKNIPSKKRMMVFMKPFHTEDSDIYLQNETTKNKYSTKKITLSKTISSSLNYIEIEFIDRQKLKVIDMIKLITDCGIEIKDTSKLIDIKITKGHLDVVIVFKCS